MGRTFVIAEAGSGHDGKLESAYELIKVSAEAGTDACKFQFWSSALKLAKRRRAPKYLKVYQKYQMPKKWLPLLARRCEAYGIEFMCTTYLPEDIAVVAPYVKRFKVASFEADDHDFLRAHTQHKKPVLVSTGMSQGPRILVANPGAKYETIATGFEYLHCVSSYPTPLEQANLRVLGNHLCDGYSGGDELTYAGYSDHTASVLTGALAVVAGARILEVHFRLDETDPANPDYKTAHRPKDLKRYVALVRLAEKMMGDGVKRPQPCEAEMSQYRVRS